MTNDDSTATPPTPVDNEGGQEGLVTTFAYAFKTLVQWGIGAALIFTLIAKGFSEWMQTLEFPHPWRAADLLTHPVMAHLLAIDTFCYIGKALGISAGVDLGYMLFTDGPDEALTPLMLGVSSAAFLTISQHPDNNWTVGVYVMCILVLMFCMRKYKEWGLDKPDSPKLRIDAWLAKWKSRNNAQ